MPPLPGTWQPLRQYTNPSVVACAFTADQTPCVLNFVSANSEERRYSNVCNRPVWFETSLNPSRLDPLPIDPSDPRCSHRAPSPLQRPSWPQTWTSALRSQHIETLGHHIPDPVSKMSSAFAISHNDKTFHSFAFRMIEMIIMK